MMPLAILAMEGSSSVPEGLSAIVTELFSTLTTNIVPTVTANPIMMIGIGATIGGIAIGWFKSLTGQKRRGRR